MRGWLLGALLVAAMLVPPASAGTDVATAAGYVYQIDVEDPEGDHGGLLGGPNDANPESDLLRVEATADAETLVFRITMATLDFTIPGVASFAVATTGPNGEDWDAQVAYGSGGADVRVGDSDPASGDPDVLLPGARVEVDAANNQIYLFADHAATGLQPGQQLRIDSISTGRGVSAGVTLTFVGLDASDAAGMAVTVPAVVGEAPVAAHLFENLTAPSFLHEFANATSDDYTLNLTVPWQNVSVVQTVEVLEGSANVTVLQGGVPMLAFHVDNSTAAGNASGDAPVLSGVAGDWSIVIDYDGFVGSLGLSVEEVVPEAPVDANTTEEPVLDADVAEDAPGPAVPLLVLGVLVLAAVVRRRL